MEKLDIYKIQHNNETRIACIFQRDKSMESMIREIEGRKWSNSLHCWHIPYDRVSWNLLKKKCRSKFELIIHTTEMSRTHNENTARAKDSIWPTKAATVYRNPLVDIQFKNRENGIIYREYVQMMEIKKYSASTKRTYFPIFKEYLLAFDKKNEDIKLLEYGKIHDYIKQNTTDADDCFKRQLISAIKLYYEKVLGWASMYFYIPKKYEFTILPIQFDYAGIKELLANIDNPTHYLLLFLVFHAGIQCKHLVEFLVQGEELLSAEQIAENQLLKSEIEKLLRQHCSNTKNKLYLFENKGKQFEESELLSYIWYLASRYKLNDVYRKHLKNLFQQTDLESSTCQQYESMIMTFFRETSFKDPMQLDRKSLRDFIHRYSKNKSPETQNSMITAIRFYYRHFHDREMLYDDMPPARKAKSQTQILSLEEIATIVDHIENKKHLALISLIYSAGMRRSEARKMRISDIDFTRDAIFIKGGKGQKDRFTVLSKDVATIIKDYMDEYQPVNFLFEGSKRGSQFSYTSMSNILKNAAQKAGIKKSVYLHLLRHSFSTHVLESGHDVRYLQVLLGHASIKTTQRYIHVSNEALIKIKSPFDSLKLKKRKPPD